MSVFRLIAVGALFFNLAMGSASAQSARLFTDWHAACDNLRTCALLGLSPADSEGVAFLQIRRSGAPGAQPDVSLVFAFETERAELPLEISVYPLARPPVLPPDAVARIGHDGLLRLDLEPTTANRLLAALRRADEIRIRRRDDAPPQESSATISLKGAAAALRWMDEQQRREGTATALVARGDKPASAIPPLPASPAIVPAAYEPRKLETKAPIEVKAAWKAACPDWEEIGDGEESAYQIASQTTLWQMPCSRGAYNFGTLFLLQGLGAAPRQVTFERPENGSLVGEGGELISGEFNEDERTIAFFAKGRGLGDCGALGRYVWDGRSFRLALWREMSACRGATLDLWPVVWRAEIRNR